MILVSESVAIPDYLNTRGGELSVLIGVSLFLSITLIAVARLAQHDVYARLLLTQFRIKGFGGFIKDYFPILKMGSVLLIVNYVVCSIVVMLLWLKVRQIELFSKEILLASVPFVVLVWNLLSVWFVTLLTGANNATRDLYALLLVGIEFKGVVYFIIAVIWVLNPEFSSELMVLSLIIFMVEFVWRLLRGYWIVNSRGVAWYYIILYLCTLEILPLFVAYYVIVTGNLA